MSVREFLSNLFRNFVKVFSMPNIIWHLLAGALTYLLVVSGFDWGYFQYFRNTLAYKVLFSAAIVGGLLPILFPPILYGWAKIKSNAKMANTALALVQAGILAWIISSLYKAFTGRPGPEMGNVSLQDITRVFNFGFWRQGIFWGWPSSHTTVAFAMSVALVCLYPRNKPVKYLAIIYAFYIGIGVSMTIHWFSDFAAGAIIGTVIGVVVGKSFKSANYEK